MAKKKVFTFFFSKHKLIFSYNIYILIFISKIFLIHNVIVDSPYSIALQLYDDNIFIANPNGMYLCNNNLEQIVFNGYYEQITNFETKMNNILIAQFDEENGGNILCFADKYFYIFSKNGGLITSVDFSFVQSSCINILPYYRKDNLDHFFLIYTENIKEKLVITHYKMNSNTILLDSYIYYKPFYLDYTAIYINNPLFTCQIMNSEKNGDVVSCCYQSYNTNLIVVQSFDIENNLSEIEEYYSKTPIDNINMITSTISPDKKNMLVCYSPTNGYGYCFIYNFDNNEITNNNPYIERCSSKYTTFQVKYFSQNEEYIFICENTNEKFTIIKFNKNFEKINLDEITKDNFEIANHFEFNSLSLIFDTNLEDYSLIIDSKNEVDNNLKTNKFLIITDFSQHFPSLLERPVEFVEGPLPDNLSIDENNKYWVYTESQGIYVNSLNEKIIIDFMDENNLFVKSKENKAIDSSIYSFNLVITTNIGNFAYETNNVEKIISNSQRIPNLTKLIYYPQFSENSRTVSFTYTLFIKNKTLASNSANFAINLCRENCSCDSSASYCKECLENFVSYKFTENCVGIDDLNHVVYDINQDLYMDCYKMCKTCFEASFSSYDMACLTCYTERGDYKEGNNCYEKDCENLFYRDKNTKMKMCIEESICPEEYPNLNEDTKECESIKGEVTTFTTLIPTTSTAFVIIKSNEIDNNSIFESIITFIKVNIGEENLDQINKTYPILSDYIKKLDISSFNEDFTISGKNITYQITTSDNQKKSSHNSNVSIIDLRDCEKIIKKKISYEDDPIPLLILKIDVKKDETKSTAIEYEVYNPYTKDKIDLSICSNVSISIYAPINLNDKEVSLYDDLNEQGYDLFDGNNSFYIDPCTQYTSENGTDVSLSDRKDYYYNEDIVLCEDSCKYINLNTTTEKAHCECEVKNSINFYNDQEFSPKILLENFYKVDTYSNFEVLFCFKLVFSSNGLKKNICFYILLVLFICFLTSMIINLFKALKKIDEIIFKIFQDRFMYYFMQNIIINGRKRRNAKINEELIEDKNNNKEGEGKPKLGWLQKLKLAKEKKENKENIDNKDNKYISIEGENAFTYNKKINLYNLNEKSNISIPKVKHKKERSKTKLMNDNKNKISLPNNKNNSKTDNLVLNLQKIKEKNLLDSSLIKIKKVKTKKEKNDSNINCIKIKIKETNININNNNNNINNIINNERNNYNPPIKKSKTIRYEDNNNNKDKKDSIENKEQKDQKESKEGCLKILKKKKTKKNIKKRTISENSNSIYSSSVNNLQKIDISNKNKCKRSLFATKAKKDETKINEKKINENKIIENKKDEENESGKKNDANKKITYIDEELNRMNYKNALIYDERNYWQYYW